VSPPLGGGTWGRETTIRRNTLNINDLTIGELEEIEANTGQPFADLLADDKPRSALLKNIAWIIKRKEDPTFTLKKASALTMEEINQLITVEDDATKSE